jgi:hypothetical protein
MPTISQNLSSVSLVDREFSGTVAFRNEKLTLPDGSKVAIGIDDELWVIVYQKATNMPFVVYEFNAKKKTVIVDKKQGQANDIELVKKIVGYFFENAEVDDLVTIVAGAI